MEQPGQQRCDDSPTQQQAEGQPQLLQQEVEVVEVDDNNPGKVLRKEAAEHLSRITRQMRHCDISCNDMQAAVNELSRHDVNRYLCVTQTWDHIKDYLKAARDQSEIYMYSQQDSCHHTRDHIQKMTEQLGVFSTHCNRITDVYLMQMLLPNPDAQRLACVLSRHMSLLREDVTRLLQIAKGEPPVNGDEAQAAEQTAGSSQPAARQG